jgi:hypothetical protein
MVLRSSTGGSGNRDLYQKTVFQSFFMLTMVQPLSFAAATDFYVAAV